MFPRATQAEAAPSAPQHAYRPIERPELGAASCVECVQPYSFDMATPTGSSENTADTSGEPTGGATRCAESGGVTIDLTQDTADASPPPAPPVKVARAGERGLRIGTGGAR